MSALTLDQLRAYLERREREASADVQRALSMELPMELSAASNRRLVYRELLEALETGRLPE